MSNNQRALRMIWRVALLGVVAHCMAGAGDRVLVCRDVWSQAGKSAVGDDSQVGSGMKISKIEPTVLFKRGQDGLLQGVDIVIRNRGSLSQGQMKIRAESLKEISVDIGAVRPGEEEYRVYVPDIVSGQSVEFVLLAAGGVQDHAALRWTPRKHWEVCLIPISHHDLGYTNPIELVMRKYRSTYRDVIKFCEETEGYPEEAKFRYSVEQAWSLQDFLESSDGATRDKMGRYIRDGRIEVQALFGQLLTHISSPEELIRLLYPSYRISRQYGGRIEVGSITDMPGLSWGLPTVLSGAGIRYFFGGMPVYFEWSPEVYQSVVKHTFWDEKEVLRAHGRPDAFYWKGPDGSKVLVYYQGDYGCWSPKSYDQVMNELPVKLDEMDGRGNPFSVMRFAGYECTDNTGTDRIVSDLVREWNSRWVYPKLYVSTNAMFFQKLETQCKDVRTFRGDLPDTDYPVGALSAAKETALNRVTHDTISTAEKLATMAYMLLQGRYPSQEIRDAYDAMMLYDEHCWGMYNAGGDEQEWAYKEKSLFAYRAAGMTEKILSGPVDMYDKGSFAGNAKDIAGAIRFSEKGTHVVVFNPLSFERSDIATVARWSHEEPFDVIDTGTGERVAHQVVSLDNARAPVAHGSARFALGQIEPAEGRNLVFLAESVPSMGYRTYRIVPGERAAAPATSLVLSDRGIENRFFRVALSRVTGTVESIYDKELGIELVDRNAGHQVNQLITRWIKDGRLESPTAAVVRRGQDGPVMGSLLITTSGAGCPEVTQEIILYDKVKRIDISDRVLKDMTPTQEVYFAFPFRMDNPEFQFEGPLSVIRPLQDQFPGSNSNYYSVQDWADVSDGRTGISLCPVDAHLVEFGGLNSSEISQAHHAVKPVTFGGPFVKELTKGHMYSFVMNSNYRTNMPPVQLGDVLFRYSICSHRGGWIEGQAKRFGWSVRNPLFPVAVGETVRGGLPESLSVCQVDKPNVVVMTLKRAEDSEGIVVRLNETEGRDTVVNVTLPGMKIAKAYETNVVEENVRLLDAKGESIRIDIKGFGIETIRVVGSTAKLLDGASAGGK